MALGATAFEVTMGGVDTHEISSKAMEATRLKASILSVKC